MSCFTSQTFPVVKLNYLTSSKYVTYSQLNEEDQVGRGKHYPILVTNVVNMSEYLTFDAI